MPRALKVCSCLGCAAHERSCPELVQTGRCPRCTTTADQRRGTRQQRGYGRQHTNRFRPGVLKRDPLCVCTDQTTTPGHNHGPECLRPSTVADHWPRDKRELQRLGLDDNDPRYGRGLCKPCHDHHTSEAQPGGWHRPHGV